MTGALPTAGGVGATGGAAGGVGSMSSIFKDTCFLVSFFFNDMSAFYGVVGCGRLVSQATPIPLGGMAYETGN